MFWHQGLLHLLKVRADKDGDVLAMTPLDRAIADAKGRFAYAKDEEARWYWAEKCVWLQIERGDHAHMIQGKPDVATIEGLVKAMMEGK